jgi:hypothetical protein
MLTVGTASIGRSVTWVTRDGDFEEKDEGLEILGIEKHKLPL